MSRKERSHLTPEEKYRISDCFKRNYSITKIADLVGVCKSTISRELKRGFDPEKQGKGKKIYSSRHSIFRYQERRSRRRGPVKMTGEIKAYVVEKLEKELWSPDQIGNRLAMDRPGLSVSHETIYKFIWRDKKAGGKLYKSLRHSGRKHKRRGKLREERGIPGRVDIEKRPEVVEKKARLGDFEGDTVIGRLFRSRIPGATGGSVFVTLVDRASKLTRIRKSASKSAAPVRDAVIKALKPLKEKTETVTFDNGREFVWHEAIAACLEAKTYFATPYHSWERGLNEHTNGLIRQYFPKKTCFDAISEERIAEVEESLNNRPRKVLDYRTPNEVFFKAFPTHYHVAQKNTPKTGVALDP